VLELGNFSTFLSMGLFRCGLVELT
jgi:hypothetical protein